MDERSAEAFCEAVIDRLVGSMALYVGDRPLAEEIAQEALARAWERWDRVGVMDAPEAWVFATARNLARRRLSRRALERRVERLRAVPEPIADIAETLAVRSAVAALPERQRTTVIARYFLGFSIVETARLMDCAEGTVKAATHQAIASLREGGLVDIDDVQEVGSR